MPYKYTFKWVTTRPSLQSLHYSLLSSPTTQNQDSSQTLAKVKYPKYYKYLTYVLLDIMGSEIHPEFLIQWFYSLKGFEAMKPEKLAIWSCLSCQVTKNKLMDEPYCSEYVLYLDPFQCLYFSGCMYIFDPSFLSNDA